MVPLTPETRAYILLGSAFAVAFALTFWLVGGAFFAIVGALGGFWAALVVRQVRRGGKRASGQESPLSTSDALRLLAVALIVWCAAGVVGYALWRAFH